MMKVVLTGKDLSLDKLWDIAVNGAEVEISADADERLEASRKLVYDLVDDNVPVYGFNTGVGWNKDHKIDKDFFGDFNRKLIYTHSLGIAPEAEERDVRAMMAVRLNCLLSGFTGIQPVIARRYAELLNAGIHPVVPERSSIGEGDITTLSHIGLAMIGDGEVNYKGKRMSSKEAHKLAGIKPVTLGPKDGLAIVSSSSFSAGEGAIALKELKDLADLGDIIYAAALEGLNGNTSPLDPSALAARQLEGQQKSASNTRKCLEGSFIYAPDPEKPVQDPLCYRSAAYINGSLRDAIEYAEKYLLIQMNTTDDNPCVLIKERRMISCSNFETTTLANAFELLALALLHVSHLSCYRTIKLADPNLTKLARFLSPDGGESHCFGAFQKAFTSLDMENRFLSNPCSGDYMVVAGDIEDHANATPQTVQKLRRMIDNMRYIYGMELIHACQAIDLRKRKADVKLGKGTEIVWTEFRKHVKLYENDRPISPDIQKAYEFVKNGILLTRVRDQLFLEK